LSYKTLQSSGESLDPFPEKIDFHDAAFHKKTSKTACTACHDWKYENGDSTQYMSKQEREEKRHKCTKRCHGFWYCHFVEEHNKELAEAEEFVEKQEKVEETQKEKEKEEKQLEKEAKKKGSRSTKTT